jgi:hypothetical protein
MDQNLPVTTPEPEPTPEPVVEPIVESKADLTPEPVKSFTSGIISLVLGLITWVVSLFSGLLDINFWFAGVIAFLSAVLAIFFGAKAKKQNPASKAGKAGRFLGWLYVIALLALVVGLILGVTAIVGLFS